MGKELRKQFSDKEAVYLIKNRVIQKGTEITFNLSGKIYDSNVVKVFNNGSKILFKTFNDIVFESKDILTIDGMDPLRLFEAHSEDNDYIDILSETNVEEDIIDKKYGILDNVELYNGLKIILKNDINKKFNNKIFTVKGVGDKITLIGQRGRPKKLLA